MFNVNRRGVHHRWGQFGRLSALVTGMLAGMASTAAAPAPYVAEGTQYAPAGSPQGDQLAPSIAFRANGGCLVWHDNFTDGDGFGVSARRLSGQLSGLSSLRINEDGVGDQQNPRVAILADGSNLIVWQSGVRDSQKIVGRVLRADGSFAGGEFTISAGARDNRNPNVAVSGDGTALVVWSADGADGSMYAVQARRVSPSGQLIGDAFIINEATQFNQREPVISTTGSGGLVVVWISENQRFENSVDVYARRVNPDGTFPGNEFIINTSRRPCTTPTVAGLPGNGFVAAWAEHQDGDTRFLWDIFGRIWGDSSPLGPDFRINSRRAGFQVMPKLAATPEGVLSIYRSSGGDGLGDGVVGQWIGLDGSLLGDELIVNTKTAGDQMDPTAAADASGRVIAVWSTFGGLAKGMDLAAQRFAQPAAPLSAPVAPYLFATSSSRIMVTWPSVNGLPLAGYEVYIDGAVSAVPTEQASYIISGLAPSSVHRVQVAYVLSDGRRSPVSPSASGSTWGEDDNADGLPDDWQALHFGGDSGSWPGASVDSDGDGADNRSEFLGGTDPNDPDSVLRVALSSTPQGALLKWNTRQGAIYQAQWSTNLREWSNLGEPRLAAGSVDSIAAGEVPGGSYFRVNLLR